MIKLCVFDFDSTLMDGETITILSSAMGKDKEVGDKLAFIGSVKDESLVKRVKLIEGLELSKALEITSNLPFITGAKDIISYLKSKNIKTVVFSGGFHIATDAAQQKLGFDLNFANELHHKNGILTGNVGGEMMFGDSKGKMLARLKSFLGLSSDEVVCVGDGANDLSMFKEAGTGIAFCANKILKEAATHIIDIKDLNEIKKII